MQDESPTLIRRLVIRLLVMLGLIAACIFGYHAALKHRFGEGELLVPAILGGLVLGVALTLLRNGIEILARRRRLGGASTGLHPSAKGSVALSGTIHPRNHGLRLPFVDADLVAVAYDVTETIPTKYRHQTSNQTGPPKTCKHMGGLVATDALLRLESGEIPLFGVPVPEHFPQAKSPAAQHADAILAHAADPGVITLEEFNPSDALGLIDEIGRLFHGNIRHEWQKPSLADVLPGANCHLETKHILAGAAVSIIADYDPQAGGLVPGAQAGMIEVFPGDARQARRDMLASAARTLAMAVFLMGFSLFITFGVVTLMQSGSI